MDAAKVSAAIAQFATQHHTTLTFVANRQTQLLEIGANVAVVQHYRAHGYETSILNPKGSTEFTVKLSTRGHPAAYSRVLCKRGSVSCEIHSNLSVEGGRDLGVYCLDVAIVAADIVPTAKGKGKAPPVPNKYLISFAEAKKLVIYPMLLAHFIGIVHEVTPQYMRKFRQSVVPDDHLHPTLITLGHFSGNSKTILKSFERRRYKVWIAESFDLRLFYARQNGGLSPFLPLDELRAKAQEPDEDADNWPITQLELDELDDAIARA